ncbi:9212_t:CDS:2 [Entrophospora sp. SA101]|nr:9212_t:CDS:2 [Entrophospora sp. SA101]
MIFMHISYKQQTADPATKNIEKAILALNNEIRATLNGHGTYVPDNLSYDASELTHSRIYTNESNITGRASITSHRSEYPDETEATWQQTADPATKNIEKAILALNNEISKMRTESEWKSETQTLGATLNGHGTYVPDNLSYDASELTHSRIYTNESNITGRASITSHRSEYPDETEATWVEFTYLFDERRKREGRSPATMYNVLSEEIRLSPATLSGFYRHQKKPHVTTLDKIEAWVNKEGKKKDKNILSVNP